LVGNRYDDLLEEENDVAQKALKRLNNRESYERIYRIRRAVQCSYQHKLLPKEQWTTTAQVRKKKTWSPLTLGNGDTDHEGLPANATQDVRYLQPLIDEVAAEKAEKNELDSIAVVRKH
jgi:ubiquinol-cytochrome c reductase subunit 7